MGANILVVEDEEKLARFVELELLHEGYTVEKATNGRVALEKATSFSYDLILLDIMLPGLNGLEVLRRLNKEHPTPVILLTARDAVMDKVSGLDAGAVDYITKPFAIEELLARIRVALKLHGAVPQENTPIQQNTPAGLPNQTQPNLSDHPTPGAAPSSSATEPSDPNSIRSRTDLHKEEGIYRWQDLTLNVPKHTVDYAGHYITLTNREFMMLETLLKNMDIVLSRDTLLEKVCGYEYVGETNVIDVYVRYLRSKIDEVFDVKMIQTVRGVGYVIRKDG